MCSSESCGKLFPGLCLIVWAPVTELKAARRLPIIFCDLSDFISLAWVREAASRCVLATLEAFAMTLMSLTGTDSAEHTSWPSTTATQ